MKGPTLTLRSCGGGGVALIRGGRGSPPTPTASSFSSFLSLLLLLLLLLVLLALLLLLFYSIFIPSPFPFSINKSFPIQLVPLTILIVNCTKFLACALQSLTNNFRYIYKLCDEKTNNVPFPEHGILAETCQPDPKDWRNADWSLHCTGRPSCGKHQVKSNPKKKKI